MGVWVRSTEERWEQAEVSGSRGTVDVTGAEEEAKVMEHADGEEYWEHQRLKGRTEKGKGNWEGVAKDS